MEELTDYVCEKAPLMTRLTGRTAVGSVVADAIRDWPSSQLAFSDGDEPAQRRVLRDLRLRIARDKRYGNPLLIMWAVSIIINLVWQWWLSRRDNQLKMIVWQQAMEPNQ